MVHNFHMITISLRNCSSHEIWGTGKGNFTYPWDQIRSEFWIRVTKTPINFQTFRQQRRFRGPLYKDSFHKRTIK
jgi:hypothetical protein